MPQTQRTRKLEEELYMVRRQLIGLAGSEAERLLRFQNVATKGEAWDLLEAAVDEVINTVKPTFDPAERREVATCPFCGKGRVRYNQPGYAFPNGLRMHLLGEGTARQCVVTKVAIDLASTRARPDPILR